MKPFMSIPNLAVLSLLVLFVCNCQDTAQPGTLPRSSAPDSSMVWIPEGEGGFWMDATEVTTQDFRRFVEATDYRTEADSFGWSGVFNLEEQAWMPVTGANWEFPRGPQHAPAQPDEPVTQVSYRDARSYADWAGKRLPTEAEWTLAATQSGRTRDYPWGEDMLPEGKCLGNWWQGPFPYQNLGVDGYPGIAPVKSFPAASNGLFDISGNVWEWTATQRTATGEYVIKGGSFLCATNYCTGFNLQQKQYTAADSGLNHLGFRCVTS